MASTQKCQWHRIQHVKNIDFSLEVLWTVLKECLLQSITRPIWWLMMMEITLLDRLRWKRVVKRASCVNQTTNNSFFLFSGKHFQAWWLISQYRRSSTYVPFLEHLIIKCWKWKPSVLYVTYAGNSTGWVVAAGYFWSKQGIVVIV